VYEAFIAFLERDLELQGPWPREMERGLGGGEDSNMTRFHRSRKGAKGAMTASTPPSSFPSPWELRLTLPAQRAGDHAHIFNQL
jgi:hypothetical protein